MSSPMTQTRQKSGAVDLPSALDRRKGQLGWPRTVYDRRDHGVISGETPNMPSYLNFGRRSFRISLCEISAFGSYSDEPCGTLARLLR
jgi:hypothetical protein